MTDPYAHSAPFIDPMIAGFWEQIGHSLAAELTRLSALDGPVIDLGAGAGRGTRIAAAALPEAPLLAVEPSAAMRTALLARLMDDPALAARTTVMAEGALECPFPERARAVLAMNMIGHLAPDERRSLWARITTCLDPAGTVVVNNPPPTVPAAVPRVAGATVRVGTYDYRGWSEAEPAGDQRVLWHMTYETLHQGRVVARVEVEYDWWVVTDEELRAEWAACDLVPRTLGDTDIRVLDHQTS
ncbi:Methyltransferase domain-containing protein [Streptomyces zhaozhouensis]|uniref:Methyltransferase domain-containing protein n=1 Tax=Streptomyces zhaozhouensis TaxID=1300267 RepID=A0A286DVS6_9ACTN|nr:class I SAM-dependent methyltransferase [Streptomyces zhaozhouensis]SOD62777.1 Methyltransferase domain-containing protein [Streptomyces zhaozhouensis]